MAESPNDFPYYVHRDFAKQYGAPDQCVLVGPGLQQHTIGPIPRPVYLQQRHRADVFSGGDFYTQGVLCCVCEATVVTYESDPFKDTPRVYMDPAAGGARASYGYAKRNYYGGDVRSDICLGCVDAILQKYYHRWGFVVFSNWLTQHRREAFEDLLHKGWANWPFYYIHITEELETFDFIDPLVVTWDTDFYYLGEPNPQVMDQIAKMQGPGMDDLRDIPGIVWDPSSGEWASSEDEDFDVPDMDVEGLAGAGAARPMDFEEEPPSSPFV